MQKLIIPRDDNFDNTIISSNNYFYFIKNIKIWKEKINYILKIKNLFTQRFKNKVTAMTIIKNVSNSNTNSNIKK